MTLTEIAIEVGDDRHPLCRATAPPHAAHAMMRIVDHGSPSGRFVALVSYVGTRESAAELARELAANRPHGEVETLATTSDGALIRISMPTSEPAGATARLLAVVRLLQQLGPETLIEPVLFRGGRIRARLLVPRRLETHAVLTALDDLQRASGFREFRVLRVAHIEPHRHIENMRPLLTPEQDTLLRLAVSMGYYANPKGATLEEIARTVGLSISPVHKRLKAAEETLVQAHVGGASRVAVRRRQRRSPGVAGGGPMEVDVVARAPRHPLAQLVAATPGSRALVQPVSEDPSGALATSLVLALVPAGRVNDLISQLRASVHSIEEVAREDTHVCLRVRGRADEGWGFAPLTAAFGGEAIPRHAVFDGDEVYVRMLLVRGASIDEIESRLAKAAPVLGWSDPQVAQISSGGSPRAPPELPEPLSARQEEVLKVAHALGYYRTPRSCTLESVASTLGVSANAIHKNLVGAEAKIIGQYLTAGL